MSKAIFLITFPLVVNLVAKPSAFSMKHKTNSQDHNNAWAYTLKSSQVDFDLYILNRLYQVYVISGKLLLDDTLLCLGFISVTRNLSFLTVLKVIQEFSLVRTHFQLIKMLLWIVILLLYIDHASPKYFTTIDLEWIRNLFSLQG